MTVAVTVSLWYQDRADFHSFSTKGQLELSNCTQPEARAYFSTDGSSYLDEVILNSTFLHPVLMYWISKVCLLWQLLRTRQRVRYLHLVRPPTPAELRKSRRERRRDALLLKTIKCVCFTLVWPSRVNASLSFCFSVIQGFVFLRLYAFPDGVYKPEQLICWPVSSGKCYYEAVYQVTFASKWFSASLSDTYKSNTCLILQQRMWQHILVHPNAWGLVEVGSVKSWFTIQGCFSSTWGRMQSAILDLQVSKKAFTWTTL